MITVEEGNRHFRVSGDFLLDFEGSSVIRYFGPDSHVALDPSFEILTSGCFATYQALHTLSVDYQKVPIAETRGLKSILIPHTIRELRTGWALHSQLRRVIFESSLSLAKMIEKEKADLSGHFAIEFANRDCELDFPGYSVEHISRANDSFHLIKLSSQA
jgi:hypothetical protein